MSPADPKPTPRAPKARTPLVRKRKSPRRALTARARKKLAPERYCGNPRCYRAPVHIGRCGTHADEHLDRLVRSLVINPIWQHERHCPIYAWHRDLFPCGGPVQLNHGIPREYRLVRWDLDNVMAGCRDVNLWASRHPEEWGQMLRDWWGEEKYERLRRLAISGVKPDYAAILKKLGEATE